MFLVQVRNKLSRGTNLVSMAVEEIVAPSILAALAQGLTEDQRKTFSKATKELKLHPYDPEEDESMYEGKSKNTYISEWYEYLNGELKLNPATNNAAESSKGQTTNAEENSGEKKKKASHNETWPKLMFLGCAEAVSHEIRW